MKKILLVLAVLSLGNPAWAQKAKKNTKNTVNVQPQKPIESTTATEDEEERRARVALMESKMTGPMHHFLMQWAGHWREEMKIWSTPKSQPIISMATRDGRIVSEGRFLSSNIIGQIGNNPYEANSVMGYDNAKMKFTKIWYDNLGTSILVLEGTYDKDKEIIDFVGTTQDPITRQPVKVHQILRLIDPNTQLLEVYIEPKEGKEIKTMEIRSTR